MLKIIITAGLLSLLASCGKETSVHQSEFDKVIFTTFSNDYIPMEKQSTRCSQKKFQPEQLDLDLHLRIDGIDLLAQKNFSPVIQGIKLKDGVIIKKASFGESLELIYDNGGIYQRINSKSQEITICPGEEYAAKTMEAAALNTAHFVEQSFTKFKSLIPDITPFPIELNIGPLIIQSRIVNDTEEGQSKSSAYMTDNALYTPTNRSIVILPSGLRKDGQGITDLWEVPMVTSHEYGHHIFSTIYPEAIPNSEIHGCFNDNHQVIETKTVDSTEMQYRLVTRLDVLTAYNEGFADLMAYYTLDKSERSVKNVWCLEVTRDVSSPVFIDGEPKVFASEVLQKFYSAFPDFMRGGCDHPSYQEPHTLGAIFAYSVDSFLNNFTSSQDEKYKTVIDWVKWMKTNHPNFNNLGPEEFFEKTFEAFIKIAVQKFNQPYNQTTCSKIHLIYPDNSLSECQSFGAY